MRFVRHGETALGKDEPAISRQTGAPRKRHQTIDLRSRSIGLLKAYHRATQGNRLRTLEVRPRPIQLKTKDEASDLLVDADLPAAEEAFRCIIEVFVFPILHATAVAGVHADIDARPIVISHRRDRQRLYRQIGSKNCSCREKNAKRGRSQPKFELMDAHLRTPNE